MRLFVAAALIAAASVSVARAEVVGRFDSGFRLKDVVQITAPPDKLYTALGQIGQWWSDEHTYSGKAANMTLKLEPGDAVRIRSGALKGLEGVVLHRQGQAYLTVAVNFLQQGASVQLSDFEVEPLS